MANHDGSRERQRFVEELEAKNAELETFTYVATASSRSRSLLLDVVALEALNEENRRERYQNGLYYGFLLAILLYNLFLRGGPRYPRHLPPRRLPIVETLTVNP